MHDPLLIASGRRVWIKWRIPFVIGGVHGRNVHSVQDYNKNDPG
jgi:hypothetical protein